MKPLHRLLACGVAVCFSTVGAIIAQDGGVAGLAERELAKRQAAINESTQLVQEGDVLREGGELEAAVANYRSAIQVLPNAPATQGARDRAIGRFAETSVQWATSLAAGGRYDEAKGVLEVVVAPEIAPDYEPAKTLRKQLDDPEYHNPALTPEHAARVEQVVGFITEAKGLVALGRYQEALESYNNVLRLDRHNTAARKGMEEIERKLSRHGRVAYDHTRAAMMRAVDEGWETQVRAVEPGLLEGVVSGSGHEQMGMSVARKVKTIVIPRVEFLEAKLSEVVEFLTAQSKLLDPSAGGGKGVNIVLDSGGSDSPLGDRRLSLSLTNLPMEAVLRYVTDLTGTRHRVEEFAVHIMDRNSGSGSVLRTKSFRVPPDFISRSSEGGGAGAEIDPFAEPADTGGATGLVLKRLSAKEFLEQNGVSFEDGADAAFMAATSMLVVTNTDENLDIVEQLVQAAFERSANQVKIDVVMLDVSEKVLNEIGFDQLMDWGNLPGSDRVFVAGGTSGNQATNGAQWIAGPPGADIDYPFQIPGAYPLGFQPMTAGNRTAAQYVDLENSIDAALLKPEPAAGGSLTPGAFAIGGVFTDPQFQSVVRALNQKKGVDITMSPSVVTRSGQRADIRVIREFPYPTEFDPPEIPQSFGTGGVFALLGGSLFGLGNQEESFPVTPTTPTAFDIREVGTSLEVEPIIGPDGRSIDLNLVPEFDEFEGFINYGTPITDGRRVLTENRIVMPIFRTVRESVQVTVWDGQTVVIGGLMQQEILDGDDKTPIFGDLPYVGRFFSSDVDQIITRAIVFMVRVNIIDPGGNTIRGEVAQ